MFEPDAYWPGIAVRYLLDGGPSSVTARFEIEGTDYTNRIADFSRLEQEDSELFLQLWFEPSLDPDGGPLPDLDMIYLDLWSHKLVFSVFSSLPPDLSFLGRLPQRRFGFVSSRDGGVGALATTLQVPEPASTALVLLGIAGFLAGRRRCWTPRPPSRE